MVSTDGRTDTEGYNVIPRHTLVAGYKKVASFILFRCHNQNISIFMLKMNKKGCRIRVFCKLEIHKHSGPR